MKKLCVHKAEPWGDERSLDLTIEISQIIPRQDDLEDADRFFMTEAISLEEGLFDILPGGTYDRLLGLMLRRKASHFIISYAPPEQKRS